MKPLHVGLLIVGAAIAGGVAVKLTQPTVFPVNSGSRPASVKSVPPAIIQSPQEVQSPPAETTPPAVSPVPEASAPPPVYREPKPSPIQTKNTKTSPAAKASAAPQAGTIAKNVPPPYSPQPAPSPAPQTQSSAPEPGILDRDAPSIPPSGSPSGSEDLRPQQSPEPPAAPAPRQVTLRAGTTIPARIIETLSSDKVRPGDNFQATLAEPLVADGLVIAERGARVTGKVIDSSQAGKFQGVSKLELALVSVYSSDGQKVAISTSPWKKQSESQRNGDVAKIGGGAALGAIIGAIAGGGKGAAIGAGVGGAAGTGAVMIPQTRPITIATETVIQFRLSVPVTITERI